MARFKPFTQHHRYPIARQGGITIRWATTGVNGRTLAGKREARVDEAASMIAAGERYSTLCSQQLQEGAHEIARARDRLRALLDEQELQRRDSQRQRVAGQSWDGLARVICSGTGEVIDVDLDPARYRRVTAADVAQAVLEAMGPAADPGTTSGTGAAAGVEPAAAWAGIDDPEVRARIEQIVQQYRRAERDLAGATASGTGPQRAATAEYDGLGRLRRLSIASRAMVDLRFPVLAKDIVAALRAGAEASVRLRERTYDSVVIDGTPVSDWRRYPNDPADAVRRAFAADLPVRGGGRS